MSFSAQADELVTIRRFSEGVADSRGHPVQTWADLATGVPVCRREMGGEETWADVEKTATAADYIFYLPPDALH